MKIFGLVGNPVSHSKGVYFHNRIFRRKKINALYLNFLTSDLRGFLDSFRQILHGFSVTMPFKEQIFPFLDCVETDAMELGAVNTVLVNKGKFIGCNTDLPAIASVLARKTSLRGKRVTVMGTGGTARTAAHAAIAHHAVPTIVGRSPEKARALARELGCEWTGFENLREVKTDILINGTPVGMHPGKERELVQKTFFRKGMVVFDAVASPAITRLLASAESAGCAIITGVELFKRQAQLQSKLFLRHIA